MSRTKATAVVLREVDVPDVPCRTANGLGELLLLDVHVERIRMQRHGRVRYLIEQPGRVVERVQKVRLEAIERLDSERDAKGRGAVAGGAQPFDARLPLRGRARPSR